MNLIDVKRTKEDKKAEAKRWEDSETRDDYPWGLRIHLDEETVEKLKLGDIDAGHDVTLHAKCFVAEDSINKANGQTRRHMALQITAMALEQGEPSPTVGDALYGEGK